LSTDLARPVLGIESSCDETAAAVVDSTLHVHSSVVASQDELHAPFGGVVPEIASRSHLARIVPTVQSALARAGVTPADLGGVAVTRGPGLVGALLVGVQTAKAFAWVAGLPLVGINHLEAHVMAVLACADAADADRPRPEPPWVALLVSGGHTALYLVTGWGRVRCLGGTRDDAAGEALDKFARLVGLPYPGGPVVDRLARDGDPAAVRLPRALLGSGLDLSFSGLKSAVRRHVEEHGRPAAGRPLADLCASLQEAVADVLVAKALAACEQTGVPRLVLCGGVAANSRLRALAAVRADEQGVSLFVPPRALCTDNAAMVAAVGVHRLAADGADPPFSLDATPTLPLGE